MKIRTQKILEKIVILLVGYGFIALVLGDWMYALTIVLGAIIFALIVKIFTGFYVPTESLFKRKFVLQSIGFGIGIFFFLLIQSYFGENAYQIEVKHIVVSAIATLITVALMTFVFKKGNKLDRFYEDDQLEPGEVILLQSQAVYLTDEVEQNGVLILGEKFLYFIHKKDAFFQKFDRSIKIIEKKWWIWPTGLDMGEGVEIRVSFPRFWLKKINGPQSIREI